MAPGRRHRTREQKRQIVAESIKADPQLSDREHGRRTGVDNKTAASVRSDLVAREEIPHVHERTDSAGRSQPASKPRHQTTFTDESGDEVGGIVDDRDPDDMTPTRSETTKQTASTTDRLSPVRMNLASGDSQRRRRRAFTA